MSKKKHKKAEKAERAEKAASHGGHRDKGRGDGFPSMLREAGAALLAKADTPQGREAIASGLAFAAAAASAAASRAKAEAQSAASATRPAQPPAEGHVGEKPEGAKPEPQVPPVMDALNAAASAFMSRLMQKR